MKINKQTKLPMCSDEVLKVSYSADGIDFVVQNVYTMGKSPGGLSGHAAALLQDQSGTLQDGPKCTSTRMIISGGTNTGKYSSEGAAREWSTVIIVIVIFIS